MASAKGKWLSSVDQAWLRMDSPTNLMVVNGLMCFEQPLRFEEFLKRAEERLVPFRRFRRKVVEVPLLRVARWEDDLHYDIRNHVRPITVPAPGGEAQMRALVGDLMSTPLDHSKPLWQAWFIEDYQGGSAVIVRIHHCLADGVALVRVITALTDPTPAPVTPSPEGAAIHERTLLSRVIQTARRGAHLGREVIADPARGVELAKTAASGAAALLRLVTLPTASPTLKGVLGPAKRAAWSRPIPLEQLQRIRKHTGATINDICSAAVAGGLRAYLAQRGALSSTETMRALVPVDLRGREHREGMGNRFGLVFLDLPVDEPDRMRRLEAVRHGMAQIKGSPEAAIAFLTLFGVGMITPGLQERTLGFFGGKVTMVLTNVQGPRALRYYAGSRVRDMMFWVPMSARLGMGLSVLSYDGVVRIGLATDSGIVPDPEAIVEAVDREVEALMETVGEGGDRPGPEAPHPQPSARLGLTG